MKYRDRNEIIAQILESANGDRVRITRIKRHHISFLRTN